jgi:hypothetical protein
MRTFVVGLKVARPDGIKTELAVMAQGLSFESVQNPIKNTLVMLSGSSKTVVVIDYWFEISLQQMRASGNNGVKS